eukprot:COSAG06_NODE_2610_length_6584_cov_12.130301_3_plen_174_part_00
MGEERERERGRGAEWAHAPVPSTASPKGEKVREVIHSAVELRPSTKNIRPTDAIASAIIAVLRTPIASVSRLPVMPKMMSICAQRKPAAVRALARRSQSAARASEGYAAHRALDAEQRAGLDVGHVKLIGDVLVLHEAQAKVPVGVEELEEEDDEDLGRQREEIRDVARRAAV